ncbi:apoptotic protease-activating factor 1-like isoform X1 [Diorhabda carinulata]|uniref:apoptotic protease-activating factor 1-like isoform X1 n=1 Tax=Diorhabda carinulata TaxID=1163345 RepID=UPI0025A1C588|nr:apoptotic protease-activating factor 1-like isoform X1 [Diorhabda carinulata]
MDGSLNSQINQYKRVIRSDLDDFTDFLISKKILNEKQYKAVWKKEKHERIDELFSEIHSNGNLELVLKYLRNTYPEHERDILEKRNFRLSFVRGGFPELPPNYVPRESLEWCKLVNAVKANLQDLNWDETLVIHGMMGYGKSCLINNVLRDETVRQYFDNYIFWINLGDCHSKEDAWQPMWRLYTSACSVLETKISHCHDDHKVLIDSLTKIFLNERLRNAIIILDNVSKREVLACFDIKVKTIITTQYKNIINGDHIRRVEVSTGFSSAESLELFKKSLKTNHDLPGAAEEIHNICQGHPMLISLIGSYLSENIEDVRAGQVEIWKYIKQMLLKGNYSLNQYTEGHVNINEMINTCVEKLLTDNLRELYQTLAVFEKDVNIPPVVLQILWDKDPSEVRNIMNSFAEKSLIVRFYHNDLKTYIYGIHDIYLNYLKKITKNNTKDLHRRLLAGYDRVTNRNYANLPNDNYTLQFIGHHIYHGEDFDKFQIYLNLKFLELKIKSVGTEDTYRDMEKYEIYITRKESFLKEKLKQYKDFIKRCGGNLYSYEKTDIIQYALKENRDSFVFKDALHFAKSSSHLYLQLQKPIEEFDYSQIINIKDDITSACFFDSPHHILIGTTNGKIKLFYEQSSKEISNFVGHAGAIMSMIISPDRRYFLSVSRDGTVILWKFAADSTRNSLDLSTGCLISPKTKQSYWQDIHTADRGQIYPRKKFKIPNYKEYLISAAFHNDFPDTFRIATGSNEGNVTIWDAHNEVALYETGRKGMPVPCILYTNIEGDESVIFGLDDSVFIYKVINDKFQYFYQFHNNIVCNSIFLCYNQFWVVGDTNITMWSGMKKKIIFENDEVKNICSTLTDDNRYLIVSTDRSTVRIWNIEQQKILREFRNRGLANSLDTFYDEDNSVHILLIGSDKKTLQQCHIQPCEREPQVRNIPTFTPYWKKKNALTATSDHENRLQIFNNYSLISESEPLGSQITCTCFSVDGDTVIYGMENGEIRLFKTRTKEEIILEKANNRPITFLKCYDPTNSYLYTKPFVNSGEKLDSLDFFDPYIGIIVSVTGTDTVTVYNDKKIYKRTIQHPVIFHVSKQLLILDSVCNIYEWDVESDEFNRINNNNILETVDLKVAAFCSHKYLIGAVYDQCNNHFCDIYNWNNENSTVQLLNRIGIEEKVTTVKFSCDGCLLAIGMSSGAIKVFNLDQQYKSVSLLLHDDEVQDLIFSPHKEPILVSVGEEIAWWNLKTFQNVKTRKGRPKSIDILESLVSDLNSMDVSFWSERQILTGTEYLLSLIRMKHKVKYISASNDFNSFLTIDTSGKIYIMEIVQSTNNI